MGELWALTISASLLGNNKCSSAGVSHWGCVLASSFAGWDHLIMRFCLCVCPSLYATYIIRHLCFSISIVTVHVGLNWVMGTKNFNYLLV